MIAMLTDFGARDGYVAVMKAVISTICPGIPVIDISHDISPQNIAEAKFVLWSACRYFPSDTIFVCVVDPGVGTERKIIALKTKHHIFLAPDNGLLDLVLHEYDIENGVEVTNKKYFLKHISHTFHGRDIFSPVAAHLASGIQFNSLGTPVKLKKPKEIFVTVSGKDGYYGNIIYIDRFGNLVTNFKVENLRAAELKIKNVAMPLNTTYGDVNEGEFVAYTGSSGLIEIAIRNGNARQVLNADYGTGAELIIK
jgi:S-adenosylmethionine hydrolase